MKSLKKILDEEQLLNNNSTAIKPGKEKEAEKIFYDYINDNFGFPNKQLVKIYKRVKEKNYHKEKNKKFITRMKKVASWSIDQLVQSYVLGATNRETQEAIGLIIKKDSHILSLKNVPISYLLIGQYYAYGFTIAKTASFLSPKIVDYGHELGTLFMGIIGVGNLVRLGLIVANKKSYASWGLDGFYLNLTTYIKKYKHLRLEKENKVITKERD